jgi:catechol 2,3-dioxygenase-like lactoylglutathione lyase family enzyme
VQSKLGWPEWIGVVAEDMDGQAAFYRDVLGLRQVDAGDDWVQFDFDGRTFEILGRSALSQYDARRVQVGFTVEDIETAREELLAAGVKALTAIEGDHIAGARWCYFRDPEGNVFEITQRARAAPR